MNRKWISVGFGALAVTTCACLIFLRMPTTMQPTELPPSSVSSTLPVPLIKPASEPRLVKGRAQLVAMCPSGGCSVFWSQDGKTVLLQGSDTDLASEKRDMYFDSGSLRPLSFGQGKKRFSWVWRWHSDLAWGEEGTQISHPLLSVQNPQGRSVSLQGTNQTGFATTQTGYSDFSWGFTAETFSLDNREFSVLIDGELLTWNTSTGQMVRRARLALRPNSVVNIAEISRDGHSIMTLPTEPHLPDVTRVIVYDTRTGQERYSLNHTGEVYAHFSPSGKVLMVGESTGTKGLNLWFYNAASGRKLWMWRTRFNLPIMLPHKNEIVKAQNQGLEVRDLYTGRIKHILLGPAPQDAGLTPSPDGSGLWSSQNDGKIWSWSGG